MARFFVKGIPSGSVFGYLIKDNLVEVKDEEHIKALRKEPDRFQEVADIKEAATSAASLSTSEADENPVEVDKEEEEVLAPKKQMKVKKKK